MTVSQKVVTPLKKGVRDFFNCLTTLDFGFLRNYQLRREKRCDEKLSCKRLLNKKGIMSAVECDQDVGVRGLA